jgi:hypothetical protein
MADPHSPLISGGGWQQIEMTRQWRAHACTRVAIWTLPLAAAAAILLFTQTSERGGCWAGLGLYATVLLGLIGFRIFEKPVTRTVERRLPNTNQSTLY